jgi:hypothetical protein
MLIGHSFWYPMRAALPPAETACRSGRTLALPIDFSCRLDILVDTWTSQANPSGGDLPDTQLAPVLSQHELDGSKSHHGRACCRRRVGLARYRLGQAARRSPAAHEN